MQISPLSWQDLTVNYPFSNHLENVRFFDFQPKAQMALSQLIAGNDGSALILKTETLPEFITEITDFLESHKAGYLLQTDFERQNLFGHRVYLAREGRIETISGILQGATGRILILSVAALLRDITQWDKLKQALLFGHFLPENSNAVPEKAEPITSRFKLLLIGNRDEIALLHEYDDSLFGFAHYAEVVSYFTLQEDIELWGGYVQTAANHYLGKTLSRQALNQLLQYSIRQSESRELVSISPTQLKFYLQGLQGFFGKGAEFDDIQPYFDYLESQSATLHDYALQDILSQQIYVETEGEEIGQINGLSVVEFDGVPHAFGEPLRISCNVQYGDGEIHDIERKVELGGNIHSKGILIAQSCLANLLEFPTQLPFSATIAFEQSYGEIDGDSSSLAIFCSLISALAKLPLPQTIAVTGAIDQYGNVLSVGGVNQKIEGFFDVCAVRGFAEKQGVIIPAVCLSHLSLKREVIEAVKAGTFSIWVVEDVFEALFLLLEQPFFDEDVQGGDKPSLYSLIHQQLEQNPHNTTSGSIWQKICKMFKAD